MFQTELGLNVIFLRQPLYVYIPNVTAKSIRFPNFILAAYASSFPACNILVRGDKPYMLKNEGRVSTQCDHEKPIPPVMWFFFERQERNDEQKGLLHLH